MNPVLKQLIEQSYTPEMEGECFGTILRPRLRVISADGTVREFSYKHKRCVRNPGFMTPDEELAAYTRKVYELYRWMRCDLSSYLTRSQIGAERAHVSILRVIHQCYLECVKRDLRDTGMGEDEKGCWLELDLRRLPRDRVAYVMSTTDVAEAASE